MENNELLKRGEDLARRCENKGCLTSTGFLTPAEQYALAHDAELRFSRMVFRGGHEDFERGMAFFLPDYMEEAEALCDRVCILKSGKKVAEGALDEVIAASGQNNLENAYLSIMGEEELLS